jgi:hypothetical protein
VQERAPGDWHELREPLVALESVEVMEMLEVVAGVGKKGSKGIVIKP